MEPVAIDYAKRVILRLCEFLDDPENFEDGKVSFEPNALLDYNRYTATTTHHGVLGTLVLLGYLNVSDKGRAGLSTKKPGGRHVYSASREQLERLKRDIQVSTVTFVFAI